MQRSAKAISIAIAVTATLVAAFVLVAGMVFINRDRLGLGDPQQAFAPTEHLVGGKDPRQAEDPDLGTMDVYDVLEDGTLDPPASGVAAEVWETFTRLATPAFTSTVMLTYEVGNSWTSDLLAWVIRDERRPEYWHLAVNLAGAVDEHGDLDLSYLLTTLIHEYAHILTLDTSQVPTEGRTCKVEAESEGCWYEDAILSAFWDAFWSGYGKDAPSSENEDSAVGDAFYEAHEEDFVTGYAAKNVVEDIAECFMAYVIEPIPDPSDSVVAAKLAFFERYPELSAIRERIRAEFGDELQPVWDA